MEKRFNNYGGIYVSDTLNWRQVEQGGFGGGGLGDEIVATGLYSLTCKFYMPITIVQLVYDRGLCS